MAHGRWGTFRCSETVCLLIFLTLISTHWCFFFQYRISVLALAPYPINQKAKLTKRLRSHCQEWKFCVLCTQRTKIHTTSRVRHIALHATTPFVIIPYKFITHISAPEKHTTLHHTPHTAKLPINPRLKEDSVLGACDRITESKVLQVFGRSGRNWGKSESHL